MDLTLEEASARAGLTPKEIANALVRYIRSVPSGDSPYDRFVNGDCETLTDEQQFGLQIFRGRSNCHAGPTLTDEKEHNTGVAWRDGRLTDPGAGRGDVKTPTHREVSRKAPYMHDGRLAALDELMEFHDGGGRKDQETAIGQFQGFARPQTAKRRRTNNLRAPVLRGKRGDHLAGARAGVKSSRRLSV